MTADNLTAPLGLGKSPARWRIRIPYGLIGFGLIVTLAVSALIWVTVVDDPLGGEPNLIIALGSVQDGIHHGRIAVVDAAKTAKTGPDAGGTEKSWSEKPDVPPDRPGDPTEELTEMPLPGSALSVVPVSKAIEKGRHGPLPKLADGGKRPLDLYAAPIRPEAVHLPKVVLVVGGMGLSQRGTQAAIEALPRDVTLAFAPYGASLDRWMREARKTGHEVMLQVPLEPFDYPDNDPGPHTLITALPASANIDRLHWVMSRLTNYTGIVNYMGARFTASTKALKPVLTEVRNRGLMYMDDGSSSRSVAARLAASTNTPFVRADLVVDAEPGASEIDSRLLQLEAIARSRGLAVGMASALPVTIERIAEWARSIEARGVYLVPISAAVKAAK